MKICLRDKVAVITGAAQGLGAALAQRLAEEGCRLALFDLKADAVEATASELQASTGGHALAVAGDVTQESAVQELFAQAQATYGQVDLVVANAAILIAEPIEAADAVKWKAVLDVNLYGQFLTFKHACAVMKKQQSGVIVQINSKSGKKGSAANSAYAASKFGGIGLVQSVALEMAPYGVRVNAVCPGNLLDSPLWTDPDRGLFIQYLRAGKVPGATQLSDVHQHYVNQVPLRRGCTYRDIGNVVVFLASDHASYMTGQAINVTGGQEMR